MKKALLILASKDFRKEEYEIPRKILEDAGVEVKIASLKTGTVTGYPDDATAEADLTLDQVNVDDFNAVVFIGGQGAAIYQTNEQAHRICQEAVDKNKILAAICMGPTILAKAGVLKNKKATVWSSESDRLLVEILEQGGAVYTDSSVVQDGNIITADGVEAAEKFGQAILSVIK